MTNRLRKKYVTNENDNIIQVHSTSIIFLLIFMSGIIFHVYLRRDVLFLLSTVYYE